jgi:hypothetical protein
MRWVLHACVPFVFWNHPLVAQQLPMRQWLNTGTHKEQVDKIVSLGVERKSAELAAGKKVDWRAIRGESRRKMAILFIPCNLDSASLNLLEGSGQKWHVTDGVSFDCHYDSSVSLEVVALRTPNVDDVLIHHECEGHGTGILQQNFNVFAIVGSRLQRVLNTEEVLKVFGWPGAHEIDQRSSFILTPATRSGSGVIKETIDKKDNGTVTVEKREFYWSPAESLFLPSPFVKVK